MGKLDHEGIGQRLRAVREITRLRDREIAMAVGVGRTAVSESMNGRGGMGIDKLYELATLLRVNHDWLLFGNGKPPAKRKLRESAEALMWSAEDDR